MKAMILAAGKGERMRPLTEHTPKPLLQVGGKPLIEHHIEKLAAAGFDKIVVNIAYLGEQIIQRLGSGERWNIIIHYSQEPEPLETAGALLHAQPLLGDDPFLLINGDIWTDFSFATLKEKTREDTLGHLVLINNPEHNPEGDFSVDTSNQLIKKTNESYTFSGISIIHPNLINTYTHKRKKFPLGEVLRDGIEKQALSAEVYKGKWIDVGTVERLNLLNKTLASQ